MYMEEFLCEKLYYCDTYNITLKVIKIIKLPFNAVRRRDDIVIIQDRTATEMKGTTFSLKRNL